MESVGLVAVAKSGGSEVFVLNWRPKVLLSAQ